MDGQDISIPQIMECLHESERGAELMEQGAQSIRLGQQQLALELGRLPVYPPIQAQGIMAALARMQEDMTAGFAGLGARFDGLETRFDGLETRVQALCGGPSSRPLCRLTTLS